MEHKNEILPVALLFIKTRSFVCENNKLFKIGKVHWIITNAMIRIIINIWVEI